MNHPYRITKEQRRAANLLSNAINLVTILPLARDVEREIFLYHMDELMEMLIQEYKGDENDKRKLDAIRDLALSIITAAKRLQE